MIAPQPPCPIPVHALVLGVQTEARSNDIRIYDRDTGVRTCVVHLPFGEPQRVTVAADGRIFVVMPSDKVDDFTTDAGHIDVIGPDGRLLQQYTQGIVGPRGLLLLRNGDMLLLSGEPTTVNGDTVLGPSSLVLYDSSMQVKRTYTIGSEVEGVALSSNERTIFVARTIFVPGKGYATQLDAIDLATGGPSSERPESRRSPDYRMEDGIRYEVRYRSNTYTPRSRAFGVFPSASTIVLQDVATKRSLPSIHLERDILLDDVTLVNPDPRLAHALAGAYLKPPVFPSIEQLREALPASAGGVQFDETISGRHYTYLGDYARIDDPKDHSITLVDCAREVAAVTSHASRTYRVLRMDATTLDQQGSPDPGIYSMGPPASVRIDNVLTDRALWQSPIATFGYETRYAIDVPYFGAPFTALTSYEFASFEVMPSCAMHSFGGEPLAMEPATLAQLAVMGRAMHEFSPAIVSIAHPEPVIPSNDLIVRMESGSTNKVKHLVDVQNLRPVDTDALSLFAIPAGYSQDLSTVY